ncbi:MAG: hypothetical protein WBE18_00910 [Gammaproteobacteria bacterium]
MAQIIKKELKIVNQDSSIHKYNNETCPEAGNIYKKLAQNVGCTCLTYLYENLVDNEKFIYSSNQLWLDLFIDKKLINNCPITLLTFNFLEEKPFESILLPWYLAPPINEAEKKVSNLMLEFNIANGISYVSKKSNDRESLALGGERGDKYFYKNFIYNIKLFNNTLKQMRAIIMNKVTEFRGKEICEFT